MFCKFSVAATLAALLCFPAANAVNLCIKAKTPAYAYDAARILADVAANKDKCDTRGRLWNCHAFYNKGNPLPPGAKYETAYINNPPGAARVLISYTGTFGVDGVATHSYFTWNHYSKFCQID